LAIVAKFLNYDYNISNLDISVSTNVLEDAVGYINDGHDVSFDIRLKLRLEGKWDEGFVVPSTRN
jgi:hypothetical protein